MTRGLAILGLICLYQNTAVAEGRINGRVDFNHTDIEGVYSGVTLQWQGIDVEFEKTFDKNNVVLSGIGFGVRRELFYGFTGFGVRKDVDRWDEGTYLAVRIFRYFELPKKGWSAGPSFALLYGVPGTTLDRTVLSGYGAGSNYLHVFPMRNVGVPPIVATETGLGNDAALFYPEVSVVLRRQFANGGISFDWIGGVRIIRFGLVDSNSNRDVFSEHQTFIPSIGLRVGFRVF